MKRNLLLMTGSFVLGLAARLMCEALHPELATVALVTGVVLLAKGVQQQ